HGAEAQPPARRARDDGQRQVDPRDARHRRAARRAPLLPPRGVGAAPRERVPGLRADRRGGADHPVELPAADARLEGGPRARRGEHGGAQAGGVHPAHGDGLRRARARRGAPARRAQRRGGRRRDGEAHRRAPGRRQDRLHRLHRGRPADPHRDRREREEALARARREEPIRRLRRRGPRQRRGGGGRRDLVQPGAGVLRRLAAARARGHRRPAEREAQGAHGAAPHRRAARQGRRHGGDRRARAARAHPHARGAGGGRGLRDVAALVGVPGGGVLLPPHAVHQRQPGGRDRAGRDLRPGARRDDVPHAERGGGAGEQHPLRARRERVDGEHQPRPGRRAEDQGGRGVGERHQPVRRERRLRRLPRERVR
ncbi:MAG: Aldehyde dehydrogenase, partial [uncultured Gemmatimonadaceae bacterium]